MASLQSQHENDKKSRLLVNFIAKLWKSGVKEIITIPRMFYEKQIK